MLGCKGDEIIDPKFLSIVDLSIRAICFVQSFLSTGAEEFAEEMRHHYYVLLLYKYTSTIPFEQVPEEKNMYEYYFMICFSKCLSTRQCQTRTGEASVQETSCTVCLVLVCMYVCLINRHFNHIKNLCVPSHRNKFIWTAKTS